MAHPVSSKTLVVVVGATATGKTELAIELAKRYRCEILSADSRQCYRELGIATAKPSDTALKKIKHHFINSHGISQPVTVAEFENYALSVLDSVFRQGNYCIMAGGSGLYVKAVTDGLDKVPDVPDSVRENLEKKLKKEGLESLVKELTALDRDVLQMLDLENPRRVIRALEVSQATGKPYSQYLTGTRQPRPFRIVKIGLRRDRQELYQRINERMDQMLRGGLFEEAVALYPFKDLKPLQTVGYQEVFGHLDGLYDREEMVRLLKRNSRRYAKRQHTWFGKDDSIRWFAASDLQSIWKYLRKVAPADQ